MILIAGFRPWKLKFPNQVQWSEKEPGLQFGRRGIAYTRDEIRLPSENFSVELVIQPRRDRTWGIDYIVEFYDRKNPQRFVIGQRNSHLIVRSRSGIAGNGKGYVEVEARDLLHPNEYVHIVISSNLGNISIYTNGSPIEKIKTQSFDEEGVGVRGRLILGNSADGRNFWLGKILHLVLWDRALTDDRVLDRYRSWTSHNSAQKIQSEEIRYEYFFNEGQGNVVSNARNKGGDLIVPPSFKVVKRRILVLPWRSHSSKMDILVNILGFIPLGFFFALYFNQVIGMKIKYAFFATFTFGTIMSLFIEVVQSFIPVRHSSTLDLVLNSLGTLIGIGFLYFVSMNSAGTTKINRE